MLVLCDVAAKQMHEYLLCFSLDINALLFSGNKEFSFKPQFTHPCSHPYEAKLGCPVIISHCFLLYQYEIVLRQAEIDRPVI